MVLIKTYYVLFEKISGIIHLTPLLLVPFTEYPSSPSLCMYVGNMQEVGVAEVCVFCMYVMSAVRMSAILMLMYFVSVGLRSLLSRCNMYFVFKL